MNQTLCEHEFIKDNRTESVCKKCSLRVNRGDAPEARVDWEEEREFLISIIEDMRCENKLHGHITDASAKYLIWKAKQAAFEKGREER